jgi:competence protein ComEC
MDKKKGVKNNYSLAAFKSSSILSLRGSTTPLLFPALFWITGIAAGFYLPLFSNCHYFLLLMISLSLFLSVLFLAVNNRSFRIGSIALLIFVTGYFRAGSLILTAENQIGNLLAPDSQITKNIVVSLMREPEIRKQRFGSNYRIEGTLQSIDNLPVKGKIILTFPESYLAFEPKDLVAGAHIKTIAEISPYHSREEFSRIPEPYYRLKNSETIIGKARTPVYPADRVALRQSFVREQIINIRRFINGRINARIMLPPAQGNEKMNNGERKIEPGFTKAVLLGERRDLGYLRDLMVTGGMTHLTAISGLHLGIVTLFLLTLLKLLHVRRTPAAMVLILFFILYGELCSWSASISRAVVMLSLLMICRIFQRKPSYNNILAATLIIITAISPLQIFSIGLQFSFLSVFVLINILPFFTSPCKAHLLSKETKPLNLIAYRLCQLFLASLFISLFLSPLTLYYFNHISLNGLIGNVIGILMLGLIMPLALLIVFLPPFPLLLLPFQELYFLLISIFSEWSDFVASLPLFFDFIPFNRLQLLLAGCFLGIFSSLIMKKQDYSFAAASGKKKVKGCQKDSKFAYWFFPVLMVFILLVIVLSSLPRKSGYLTVSLFHVGHGDSFLIETPDNERILIDTGASEEEGIHFRFSVLPYFKQKGISKLDWLIITHPHSDHYGGLPYLAEKINIENLMITEDFYGQDIWKRLQTHIDTTLTALHLVRDTTSVVFHSLKCKILHPDTNFFSENPNEMSLVVKIVYGEFSLLFTGDIELEGELHLVKSYPEYLKSRFLKVAHHGSRTSSSPLFIEAVSPEYGFIPVDSRSRFNLPHQATLANLKFLGDYLFLSSRDGTVQLKTDGCRMNLRTLRSNKRISVNLEAGRSW